MYRMNKRMLLAILATTAVLTIITSSTGTGIFSQQAYASNGAQQFFNSGPNANVDPDACTIEDTPTGDVSDTKFHAEHNSAGITNFHCIH
jgi:hypothetical protein